MAARRGRDDDLVEVELEEHDGSAHDGTAHSFTAHDGSAHDGTATSAAPPATPRGGTTGHGTALVGAEPAAPAPDAAGPPTGTGTPRRWRAGHRGRRVTALVAVMGVLGFAVGANVLEARREAAQEAALAEVPGMLRPLDGPVAVLWEVDGMFRGDLGEVLLVTGPSGLQGIDAVTGSVLWSRSAGVAGGAEEDCTPIGRAAAQMYAALGWRGPSPDVQATAGQPLLLACMSYSMAYAEDGAGVFGPVTISVIDGLSGKTVNLYTASGALLNVEEVGADLVLTLALPDGHLRVSRFDPVTGDERWERTSTVPIFTPGSAQASGWGRDGDVITVTGIGSVAIDLETGAEVPADPSPEQAGWTEEVRLAGGRTATWTYAPDAAGGSGAVLDRDGDVLFELPGPVWQAHPHDGSVPEVLVVDDTASASLVGLDSRTGEEVWRALLGSGQGLVQVAGVGVVLQTPGVQAFDVTDGTVRWKAEADTGAYVSGLTDGDVVLVLRRGPDGGHEMVALALEDGALRWAVPMPAGVHTAYATSTGRLVALTETSVAALG